ncbi:MAG: NTP transferase domain-containing protein [Rhodospirillaceae bacterium]|nr:NTP transferase domain-containing protein [Rhodospirillaceae bacterium]
MPTASQTDRPAPRPVTNHSAPVRVAIAGVGNCASSLVQGLEYYRTASAETIPRLMHAEIGGWRVRDINIVAAFDIDARKVGQPLEKAIFAPPNCTKVFQAALPISDVIVRMGPVLDGVADHMQDYDETEAFRVAAAEPENIAAVLRDAKADVLLCYLPVGSEKAVKHYAQACLDTGVAMVNCVPVFLASDPTWAMKFRRAGVAIVGDDIKSQVGATIVHRSLARLFNDRGVSVDRTYQLNTGGNTDFLNMMQSSRLRSKKKSKTQSVQSQLDNELEAGNIHIGPSDYVPWQKDNKVAFIRMEGRGFGDAPMDLELRLSVEDSPNSAGVVIDALRCAALAKAREIGGPIDAPSSYFMKSPRRQLRDSEAREALDAFISAQNVDRAIAQPVSIGGVVSSSPSCALILAAGMGSRLFPNASLPKPLAPVHGLTMAEWVVRTLKEAVGINHFVVSVGHEADTVESHFRSVCRRNAVNLNCVHAANWESGNGASALAGRKYLDSDAPFLLTMCDHLYEHALPARLAETPLDAGAMLVAVDFAKDNLFDVADVMKVKRDGASITAISKTLTDWDGGDTGVMYCTAGLFDALEDAEAEDQHGLADAVRVLAEKDRARAVDVSGVWWLDVDTPAALRVAETRLSGDIRWTG